MKIHLHSAKSRADDHGRATSRHHWPSPYSGDQGALEFSRTGRMESGITPTPLATPALAAASLPSNASSHPDLPPRKREAQPAIVALTPPPQRATRRAIAGYRSASHVVRERREGEGCRYSFGQEGNSTEISGIPKNAHLAANAAYVAATLSNEKEINSIALYTSTTLAMP